MAPQVSALSGLIATQMYDNRPGNVYKILEQERHFSIFFDKVPFPLLVPITDNIKKAAHQKDHGFFRAIWWQYYQSLFQGDSNLGYLNEVLLKEELYSVSRLVRLVEHFAISHDGDGRDLERLKVIPFFYRWSMEGDAYSGEMEPAWWGSSWQRVLSRFEGALRKVTA